MSHFFNNANIWHIEFSIQSFVKYINLVEDKFGSEVSDLQEQYKEIQAEIAENKNNYEPDYLAYLNDQPIEEMIEIDVEFVQRFRNSVIVQAFSFLETELKKFCYNHAKQFSKEYTIDDLRGNNELDKAKKYLKRSANIDLTTNQNQWKYIDNYRKLRNKIVHHNSILFDRDNDFKALKDFSNENFELKQLGIHGFEIIIDKKNFLFNSLKEIEQFLTSLKY